MEENVFAHAPGKPKDPVVLALTKCDLHMDDRVAAAMGGRSEMMQILIPAMQAV